jgi:hypothetical protein
MFLAACLAARNRDFSISARIDALVNYNYLNSAKFNVRIFLLCYQLYIFIVFNLAPSVSPLDVALHKAPKNTKINVVIFALSYNTTSLPSCRTDAIVHSLG